MDIANIATTATEIVPADNTRRNKTITIQNQSDTIVRFAIGDDNIAQLTASVGIIIQPGDDAEIEGEHAMKRIAGIHGATGTKTVLWHIA